ncbi:GntR family transcriptional regulator [Paraburkholderia sp. BL23I1N1]|uniref:GntR family transcriptional regulator n=1 Tax=Paraburkholderia sp. BL23I1N1 TaxID=1938802 RepID=UPI000E71F349|nr:FCD domain-containing protein [Paraburkholderia sp. BL23I1N1]RKE38630.1 GntR family transcriptional regulator [Paraburkholderia sp. BL23I1N1]
MKSHETLVVSRSDDDANGKSRPLSEQAFNTIRRRILRGEIAPGTKLRMEVLQQQHAFSSSPLREALNRLVAEGLVTADDNRGFRVAPMSPHDLADLTNFRLLVEAEALTRSIAQGDDAWEGRVIAAYHQLERLEKRTDGGQNRLDDEWTERHKGFHMTLLSAAGSPRLLLSCSNLFDQSERYRRFSAMNRNEPRNSQDEHRRMMDAAVERKADLACAILRDHISQTARNVMLVTEQDSK